MLPDVRFNPQLSCHIPVSPVSHSPSSVLVPQRLLPTFAGLLKRSRGKAGILLRNLVEAYRHSCLSGEFPQRGGLKCFYQTANQRLVKFSFRVENGVWLEFGQMAAYLGVSRCYLFSYLLELWSLRFFISNLEIGSCTQFHP